MRSSALRRMGSQCLVGRRLREQRQDIDVFRTTTAKSPEVTIPTLAAGYDKPVDDVLYLRVIRRLATRDTAAKLQVLSPG